MISFKRSMSKKLILSELYFKHEWKKVPDKSIAELLCISEQHLFISLLKESAALNESDE